ncbi:transmembrane protein 45B isoform X2 [Aplysia californica]|uniref:Transmembrane protein 45B isoform X2 n=1 Tax=Aplysia californica TaxID=6500 RepID=A0ABM0JGT0_APLCA|nr:transmembrane protein 45B isoform X2 [Aplysia californica]
MGTFVGHAVPGTFFIVFALWYIVQTFRRFLACRPRKSEFVSTHFFLCDCLCGRLKNLPLESFVKILVSTIGCVGEIVTGYEWTGDHFGMNNAQHATMFFFFGLSGVVDVFSHYKRTLVPDLDYIVSIIALFVEWLLFRFHLHGRSSLDSQVHMLLVYAIFLNIVVVAAEIKYRNSVLCPLARGYFFLLQGSWFWQIAFILYSPLPNSHWSSEDHDQIMLSVLIFSWHCAADLVVVLLAGMILSVIYRKRGAGGTTWEETDWTQSYEDTHF